MLLQKVNIAMKKCVACQRKSSLYDRVRTFFVSKRKELIDSAFVGNMRVGSEAALQQSS